MGKKRIIKKSGETLLKEKKIQEEAFSRQLARKTKPQIEKGRIYINSSFNNTIITVTDHKGNVSDWASAGGLGFSGPKKATPFAASRVVKTIIEKIKKTGPYKIDIFVKGVGKGRIAVLKGLANSGLEILSIKDITPIPHNGPRPKKPRRV